MVQCFDKRDEFEMENAQVQEVEHFSESIVVELVPNTYTRVSLQLATVEGEGEKRGRMKERETKRNEEKRGRREEEGKVSFPDGVCCALEA